MRNIIALKQYVHAETPIPRR